jgi:hypothetical protein
LEIKQGLTLAKHNIFHFGDEDGVIARFMCGFQPAFQIRQRPLQNWSAVFSAVEFRSNFVFGVGGVAFG